MTILRYPNNQVVTSGQDPFLDISNWLGFLTAKDYLVDLIHRVHSLSIQEAKTRAKQIILHVRIATTYIRQSLEGPPEISFLPAYYAMLNLMKVYVLLGPRHADLPRSRWHGATYDVHGKDSHSLLTEVVTLKKGGVFPLFYETITSKVCTTKQLKLQIKDILPFVAGVGYEYELATDLPWSLCYLSLDYVMHQGETYPQLSVVNPPTGRKIPKNQLKLLKEFSGQRSNPNVFRGKRINDPAKREEETRAQLNCYLIYRLHHQLPFTPVCSRKLELPEELPIALLFFYMSSIVRYKPEFFSRLQDSKFWPLLSSARTHSFYAFLLAFWSFMQQANYFIVPPTVVWP